MLRDAFARSTLTRVTLAILLAAACAGASLAQDYRKGGGDRGHGRKDRPFAFHFVVVEYRGPDTAEVVVTDSRQNGKELFRKVMRRGEEARFRALATYVRDSQEEPDIQLRWKVTGPYDASGARPADETQKASTWCGIIEGSGRSTKVDVGFQRDGVRGRAC